MRYPGAPLASRWAIPSAEQRLSADAEGQRDEGGMSASWHAGSRVKLDAT